MSFLGASIPHRLDVIISARREDTRRAIPRIALRRAGALDLLRHHEESGFSCLSSEQAFRTDEMPRRENHVNAEFAPAWKRQYQSILLFRRAKHFPCACGLYRVARLVRTLSEAFKELCVQPAPPERRHIDQLLE